MEYRKVTIGVGSLGMKTYDLLNVETGESVPFYAEYLRKIVTRQVANQKQAQNTIDAVANDLKVFLEYVGNAQDLYFSKNLKIDSSLLSEIILSFPEYLMLGTKAVKTLARETALVTKREPITNDSANRYLSSVNAFIEGSAITHERLKDKANDGLLNIDVPPQNLHASVLRRRNLSAFERKKLQQRSVMCQVVSGGAKYTKTAYFGISQSSHKDDYKHFPISHIESLLDAAPTYRDRAMWALLMGTGLRTAEATQLLVSDVDIINENIQVVSYRGRTECYEGITTQEANKLSFKGRETQDVFFIYPFNEIFFDSITKYLKYERPKGLNHNYLFTTNSNRSRGRPLFATSRANRSHIFKKVQALINCPQKSENSKRFYTLHSLRHFYGYWLLNFHTTPAGGRFSLLEVQHMMGHADIESTKRYAISDKIIAREKMKLANLVLQSKSKTKGLLESHYKQILAELTSGI
ncbi:site-specific integrase [Vibrio alginolyticus]|nr:site-specific integrase [Vibrio alginolyticus]KAB0316299.1 site-specific integrase [Vibrio diabolicus]